MPPIADPDLHDIQGLGLGGYRKDHQQLLFLRFGELPATLRLLAQLANRVASAWEVRLFNTLFSEIRQRTDQETIEATWVGLAISTHGYQRLSVDTGELGTGEGANAFRQGMAQRGPQIGDTRPTDQASNWLPPFTPGGGVDAVIVVASDSREDLDDTVDQLTDVIGACGAEVVFAERGGTLPPPLRGHEHFGFKDGISQPNVDGFDDPPQAGDPASIPPGEFVLGYPNALGQTANVGSLWQHGSFVVFRRLHQDVTAFRGEIAGLAAATSPQLTADQVAAKLVGRWPSGTPDANQETDPGESGVTNAFDYSSDADGEQIPRFAHIRKANPRAEARPDATTDLVAHHRMLRRGSPFGDPLPVGAGDDGAQRGLHFISVVADVDQQFEFVQRQWLNDPNFPNGGAPPGPGSPYSPPPPGTPADGQDPVVGEHDPTGASVSLHQSGAIHALALAAEFVTVTAGEYFFLPSISAIGQLAAGGTHST